MMIRLLVLAFVAAAAADDSRNETLNEGYSLEGLQLNLSTCDLFIVALAMAENSPLIDSFEAGPAETLRREPHLAHCAVGADSPLTGPGPGHLAARPMLVAGTTPVFAAVMAGQSDWLTAILDAGGDANARRSDDLEALEFPLLYAAAYGLVREAQLLIDAGADLDAANAMGHTPLIAATMHGHDDTVRTLLAAGADCNIATTPQGGTPAIYGADIDTIADEKAYSGGDPNRPPPSLADFAEVVSPASAAVLREYGRKATHRGGSYTEDPHPDYAEEYAEL